jgi:hypothetical protein
VCLLLGNGQAGIADLKKVHIVPAAGSTEADNGDYLAVGRRVSVSATESKNTRPGSLT